MIFLSTDYTDFRRLFLCLTSIAWSRLTIIDFQIINFTRPEGGDNTSSISPTDNAVQLFMWKSIRIKKSGERHINSLQLAVSSLPTVCIRQL
jgi:hypothetical protein